METGKWRITNHKSQITNRKLPVAPTPSRPYCLLPTAYCLLRERGERGQAIVFVLLVLSLFLVAAVAFTVDIANLWFHRQMAQNAADAACTAGAMDMMSLGQGGSVPGAHFTPPTAFDCGSTTPNTSSSTAPTPCWYAAVNGYTSPSMANGLPAGQPSNNVYASFPTSVPGLPGSAVPPSGLTPCASPGCPFLRIDIVDRVKVFFMGLLSGARTQDVRALSVCGLEVVKSPVPIVVLHPTMAESLKLLGGSGSSGMTIVGGGAKGIQVNSSSSTAVRGGEPIDLCYGGGDFCGSNIGIWGSQSPTPGFIASCPPSSPPPNPPTCTTGVQLTPKWLSPSLASSDPFAQVPAPSPTGLPAGTITPGITTYGCPDPAGCDYYTYGIYTPTNPIDVTKGTAIFQPGVYHVTGGMSLNSNSCVRPAIGAPDPMGIGGTLFYFADNNSLFVGSNAGSKCLATFDINNEKCTPLSQIPGNIPLTLDGNVLLAPCSGTYGDPLGTSDPIGEQRGILFFQNRSQSASATYQGGGSMLLAGALYFHQCVTSGSDTGVGCSSGAYNTILHLNGNPGSNTYVLGYIIADQIDQRGASSILMNLNPAATYDVIKVGLFR